MTNRSQSIERCRGCTVRRFDSYTCSFMVLDLRKNCPCRECLVMVMCQTYCNDYHEARKEGVIEYSIKNG